MALSMKKEKHSLRNKITEWSEVPKDVAMGMPVLTVTGQTELYLENYRGIAEYTDTFVHVRTKTGQIQVNGRGLKIEYYTGDEMKVSGEICTIEYQKK